MTYKYRFLDTSGAFTVQSAAGSLHAIVVGSTPDQAIKIFDSAGSGGTQIAELKASIAEGSYRFDCRFAKGLHIEKPGTGKVTFIYE